MKIGERIKELRTERKLNQAELAKAIGYGQSIITEWELGRKRPISDAVIALADFFDVSADYLLGRRDD
jgi:transcriptional regulator with XRE-family HTH domain